MPKGSVTAPIASARPAERGTADKAGHSGATASDAATRARSPGQLASEGKSLRDKVPRSQHAAWKKPEGRADPIDLLCSSDSDRLPDLVPIRYGRMLESPFAFFRGAASVMAADLATTPSIGIKVQACGDCHLMNFGGFATPERNIIFDINDFDETLPAPWEWDIKRLVASIVLAARTIGLTDEQGRDSAIACARSYRKRLRGFAAMHPLQVWYARVSADDLLEGVPPGARAGVQRRIDKASAQSGSEVDFPKLAGMVGGRVGIQDSPPLIFHPEETHLPEFQQVLDQVLAGYRATLADDRRALLDRYRLVDAAIKVVGVGSVGRRCWIALMMSASNEPLFLQFKEAVASVLEPYAGASAYAHHGERVVVGQRLMQPSSDLFLGWVTAEANGRQFYVRQLRDAKIKPLVETFDDELLEFYAEACGWVLARAHAKGSDVSAIGGYLGAGDQFDEAMGSFALAYADQTERDHAALKAAVRKGRIAVYQEV
ncbi:DUF2252 domain-containing protein [Kaistia dalseonensis]|uniref:DUF2252 domain-containing protein n=1 Tax=Kaistia dalseonensis TaxID=410840 RepID=A0ABU0H9K9_9HYPH|nr:DUF2252 domain-containing protein [Kaistia dalseonensis]MCX5496389.1 DUF2252 domain-containing protein [Kaistia dalseonensis]MDQ0439010.1 hypothetical protein [Kaistia dalseonensis]